MFGNGFLPLSRPVSLEQGDRVTIDLPAEFVAGEYVWRWHTTVRGGSDDSVPKASFRQSTLFGVPLSAASLRRLATTHVPAFGPDAEVDRYVFEAMAGGRSLGEIAQELLTRFAGRFDRFDAALDRVGDLSVRYKS